MPSTPTVHTTIQIATPLAAVLTAVKKGNARSGPKHRDKLITAAIHNCLPDASDSFAERSTARSAMYAGLHAGARERIGEVVAARGGDPEDPVAASEVIEEAIARYVANFAPEWDLLHIDASALAAATGYADASAAPDPAPPKPKPRPEPEPEGDDDGEGESGEDGGGDDS